MLSGGGVLCSAVLLVPCTWLRFAATAAISRSFLQAFVERLQHRLSRDCWRSLWTRPRQRKRAGVGILHTDADRIISGRSRRFLQPFRLC
jgi:hypothetical protein